MRIFVYGTLLKGEANHDLLQGVKYLYTASTEPAFRLLNMGSFPAMTEGGESSVTGEVYEVPMEVLRDLDRLEGHPDWYERKQIRLTNGELVQAYIMPINQALGRPEIGSGNWRMIQ